MRMTMLRARRELGQDMVGDNIPGGELAADYHLGLPADFALPLFGLSMPAPIGSGRPVGNILAGAIE